MKKVFVLSTFLVFAFFAVFSQNQFTLKGKVKGINSGKAELSFSTCTNNKWTNNTLEASIVKGSFMFKNTLNEPVVATLKMDGKDIELYLEPSDMEFYMDLSHPDDYKLKGSKTQDDYVLFQKITENEQKSININYDSIRKISDELETLDERSEKYKILSEKVNVIDEKNNLLNKSVSNKMKEFMIEHPESYYPILSSKIYGYVSHNLLSVDSARILFDNLDKKVKHHQFGIDIDTFLKMYENTRIGKLAPNFSTKDVNGKLITLSDFRGKYVLLDFWSSRCYWCAKGYEKLKDFNKLYTDKGLQIIGISTDYSVEDWEKGIEKNQLNNWIEVMSVNDIQKSNQGYIDMEDIRMKYPVNPIPVYILLDKDGEIINKWDGYSEENEKEMDEVMKSIFGY